jgi:hypothetical protein
MINRRSFGKQIAASVPVVTILAAVAGRSQEQPPASPSGTTPAGRGPTQGGRGGPQGGRGPSGPPDPMAGSPLGDPLPGQKWRAHDRTRPQPRKVTPGKPIPTMSAPSDAIVLFDGKDLSQWTGGAGRGGGPAQEPRWKIVDGHAEMSGGLVTKESFGDIQLHLEWTTPTGADASRVGQQRGNSGIVFMGRYEVQVLSGYNNPTYPDGGAGGIYGVYPPMVNPCLPEGEWNTFDFVFEAPKFEADKLVKPAFITLFFNGIMVHNRAQLLGSTSMNPIAVYQPHAPELPLQLQGHSGPAWYRNIWVRRILGYDA